LRHLRRDRTRDEIASAALELINRKGYKDTPVDEIAAKALISPRTFYRYFQAKEDAFFHGLPAFEESLLDIPSSIGEGGLSAGLAKAGRAFSSAVEQHADAILPRLPHALAEPALLGQLAYRLYAAELRLARKIRPHLAPGVGRAWDAEVLAAAIMASLLAALRRWHKSPRKNHLHALVKRALSTLQPAITNLDNH
jgi:AcrR family transcriptional regulator